MTLELQPGSKSPRTYHEIGRQHAFDRAIEVRDESDESLFRVRMAAKIRGSTHQVRSPQLASLLPISGKRAAKAEAKKD